MPTYEYLCQACRHRFETWQKMTDQPLTTCPECGGHIRRVLYPTGVVFKGSGFYKTDSASNGSHSKQTASSETPKQSESTASSETSKPSESKASSTTEAAAK